MTYDLLPHLQKMLSAPGLSGYEDPIRGIIQEAWEPLADQFSVSRVGSLHALKRGDAPEPRPKVMLSAHMDAIGLMVTGIEQGLLHITQVGGIDARVLPGQMVTVHGRKDLQGMVVMPPAFLLPSEAGNGPLAINYLLLDTGLRPTEVQELVRVGDVVSFAQPPLELTGETMAGHTLDNRASVAAVTFCLDLLRRRKHAWDVWAVATSQEEIGEAGASSSAVEIQPDFAIIIDVTFAKGPGSSEWRTCELGKGITLAWGPNIHPALFNAITNIADEVDIPYTREPAPNMTGTDTYAIQVVQQGIPCLLIGVPLRYMHTPVELVSLKDIRRAGRLMAEFISGLPVDFMTTINWE
ncbi:MAG: M20/M25/M40 family metallo-hydrolase [Anaerolineaceae bacterium]